MEIKSEKKRIEQLYELAIKKPNNIEEIRELRTILKDIDTQIKKGDEIPEVPRKVSEFVFLGIPIYRKVTYIDETVFYERMKYLFNQEMNEFINNNKR